MARRVASPVFVGRRGELRDLHAAYQRALEGQPALVTVAGEAGVGKSRLVAEFTASVSTGGGRVLSGGCIDVSEGTLPYAPVIEAFRTLVADGHARPRPASVKRVDELTRLLPELSATQIGSPQADSPAASAASQTQLFETTLDVLVTLSEEQPLVLVFEDIHWADRSTRDLLTFLARNLRVGRVVIVASYRLDAVVRGHPFLQFVGELERSPAVVAVKVAPFGADEVRQQVEAILGKPPADDLLAQIVERSDGNAFFIEEILASGSRPLTFTPTLHEMLLSRVNQLPAEAVQLVRAVSAAGRQATEEVIAFVSGLGEDELVAALREAILRGILVAPELAADAEVYRVRHALLREAVLEDLLPSERRRLHASVAMVLARSAADGPATATLAAELAYHWTVANRKPEALVASMQAGAAALATHAPAEAARHFIHASRLFPDVADAEQLIGRDEPALLQLAGHVAFLAGDQAEAVRLTRAALARLGADGDPVRRGLLERQLGSELSSFGDDAEALAAMQRAVDIVPVEPSYARARVLCTLGAGLMLAGRFAESRRLCEESLSVARAVDNAEMISQSLNFLGVDLVNLGEVEAGLERLREAVRVASDAGSDTALIEAYNNLAFMLDLADQPAEGIEVATEGVAQADRLGLGRATGAAQRATAAGLLYRIGRWTEAEALIEEALQLDPQGAASFTLPMYRAQIATARGRFAEADADIVAAQRAAALARRADATPLLHATAAELAIWEGRANDAASAVTAGLHALEGTDNQLGAAPLLALGVRAEADRAERARDRRETLAVNEARTAAEPMVAAARRLASTVEQERMRPSLRANVSSVEAEWTRLLGEPTAQAWATVRRAWEEAGVPYLAAYAGYREAEASLAEPGNQQAAETLASAYATARVLGAVPLVRAINDLARRGRIALDGHRTTAASTTIGTEPPSVAFTAREREVLSRVVRGMTNRQIADALFISPKTASVHVTNILGKLGVTSRFDAAAVAQRLGLDRAGPEGQVEAATLAAAEPPRGDGAAPERVRRTFMFTDIVNSTMLMDAIGDEAWVTLRQWHDRSLRLLFERFKGEEVDHAGDGFFVVFGDPAAAVRCAISIQRVLTDHRRTEGFAPRVRIGIHEGVASRAGTSYSGMAVHTAARVAALAGAGQIAATAETAEAAAAPASAPKRVRLEGLATGVDVVFIESVRETVQP